MVALLWRVRAAAVGSTALVAALALLLLAQPLAWWSHLLDAVRADQPEPALAAAATGAAWLLGLWWSSSTAVLALVTLTRSASLEAVAERAPRLAVRLVGRQSLMAAVAAGAAVASTTPALAAVDTAPRPAGGLVIPAERPVAPVPLAEMRRLVQLQPSSAPPVESRDDTSGHLGGGSADLAASSPTGDPAAPVAAEPVEPAVPGTVEQVEPATASTRQATHPSATAAGRHTAPSRQGSAPVTAPAVAADPPAAAPLATGAIAADAPGAAPVTAERGPASGRGPADAGAVHVVAPGESLWSIAQDSLGATSTAAAVAAAWPQLYASNADTIGPDPSLIRPGQRLVVPAPAR